MENVKCLETVNFNTVHDLIITWVLSGDRVP